MTKLLLWFLALCAIVMGLGWLFENAGFVQIIWRGTVIETSVAFCFVCLCGILACIYVLFIPYKGLKAIHSILLKNKQKKRQIILNQILSAILNKDTKKSETLIRKFAKTISDNEELILLLKALSTPNKEVYQALIRNPITEQIGWQLKIHDLIDKKELLKAYDDVEELLQKGNHQEWLITCALYLYMQNEQWQKAGDILDKLLKQKLLDKKDYQQKKADILVKLNKGMEAFNLCPTLTSAVLLAGKENPQKAEKIYLKAWKEAPSWDIYKAYISLFCKENALSQFKRTERLCQENLTSNIAYLVLADSAIKARLWSEAQKQLNIYLENNPLTDFVALQMAIIELEAHHNLTQARNWLDKGTCVFNKCACSSGSKE